MAVAGEGLLLGSLASVKTGSVSAFLATILLQATRRLPGQHGWVGNKEATDARVGILRSIALVIR